MEQREVASAGSTTSSGAPDYPPVATVRKVDGLKSRPRNALGRRLSAQRHDYSKVTYCPTISPEEGDCIQILACPKLVRGQRPSSVQVMQYSSGSTHCPAFSLTHHENCFEVLV